VVKLLNIVEKWDVEVFLFNSEPKCNSNPESVADYSVVAGGVFVNTLVPYLTFGVGRLLHLPSAEAVSVRPNAQPRCNQKVTVIGCEAETSAVKPNKSPAT